MTTGLAGKQYLLGDYTLADTHLASFCDWLRHMQVDFTPFHNIQAWGERCRARPAYKKLRYFQEQLDAAMQLRLEDPLADIRAAFQSENPRKALIGMMSTFPSCDVLQQAEGPNDRICRDRILGEPFMTESGFSTSESTRALHAQQEFLSAHIDQETGEFLASEEARGCCPYFTTCDLELRRTNPNVCANQPWLSLQEAGDLCPYAVAVAAVISPIELRRGGGHSDPAAAASAITPVPKRTSDLATTASGTVPAPKPTSALAAAASASAPAPRRSSKPADEKRKARVAISDKKTQRKNEKKARKRNKKKRR